MCHWPHRTFSEGVRIKLPVEDFIIRWWKTNLTLIRVEIGLRLNFLIRKWLNLTGGWITCSIIILWKLSYVSSCMCIVIHHIPVRFFAPLGGGRKNRILLTVGVGKGYLDAFQEHLYLVEKSHWHTLQRQLTGLDGYMVITIYLSRLVCHLTCILKQATTTQR